MLYQNPGKIVAKGNKFKESFLFCAQVLLQENLILPQNWQQEIAVNNKARNNKARKKQEEQLFPSYDAEALH